MKPRFKPKMRRASGVDIARIAVNVYVCRGCGAPCAPGQKPLQCVACGRLDFQKFDSMGEQQRFAELKLLERAGHISNLETQVRFPLMAYHNKLPVRVGHYVADFVYLRDGNQVIEDFKGAITDLASWKLRHMTAQGMPVKIVT
jgi:Protein of unknown function (DUF1064)